MDGKTKRQASKDSRQIGRLEMSGAVRDFMDIRRDAILDRLVNAALDVLRRTDDDQYALTLREKFTAALIEHGY
jgi:hypothetical protein